MTAPILVFANGFYANKESRPDFDEKGNLNFSGKLLIAATAFDHIAVITCLIVCILGFTSVINTPAALNYTLLGGSIFGVLAWIAVSIPTRTMIYDKTSELVGGVFSRMFHSKPD